MSVKSFFQHFNSTICVCNLSPLKLRLPVCRVTDKSWLLGVFFSLLLLWRAIPLNLSEGGVFFYNQGVGISFYTAGSISTSCINILFDFFRIPGLFPLKLFRPQLKCLQKCKFFNGSPLKESSRCQYTICRWERKKLCQKRELSLYSFKKYLSPMPSICLLFNRKGVFNILFQAGNGEPHLE